MHAYDAKNLDETINAADTDLLCRLPSFVLYAQGERNKSADVDSTDSGASTRSFETRLKICALGFDTAGTLDAVSNVLCAAIKGDQGGSGLGKRANGVAVQEPMPEVREEKEEEDGEGEGVIPSGSGALGPGIPVDSQGDDDATAASGAAKTVAPPQVGLSAESCTTTLWSIRFTVSHLEKVLNALEMAVSGLMFVVVGASEGAEPETSALW